MKNLYNNGNGVRVKRPLREVLRERYAEITAMDRAIGGLRNFLDQEGLRENSLMENDYKQAHKTRSSH